MTTRDERRLFYVVKFIELPFEGIEDYVCVPCSWVRLLHSSDLKGTVTYPNNEDPFYTRDRVKRREKFNDEWRLYTALIKYKSEVYNKAEYWIAIRNNYRRGDEDSQIRDTQPEFALKKKQRSAVQRFWLDPSFDKPQLTVYNNPRKPLPSISLRTFRYQLPEPDSEKNLCNNRLKLNEQAQPCTVTDHAIMHVISAGPKQERSIINADNQLIQNYQTNTNSTFNGDINLEQSTQPEVVKENQSVDMSAQSTSTKIPAEQQRSPKHSDEQLFSLQPPTKQQTSPQLLSDRHAPPKLTTLQQLLLKLSNEQISPVGQNYQQPLDLSVKNLNKSDEDIKCYQKVESDTKKRPSTKTPPNTLEQATHSETMIEKSTPLVRNEQSPFVRHRRNLPAEQSIEHNDTQNSYLRWALTAPKIVPRSPSRANQPSQQYRHPQSPSLPISSTLNSQLQPRANVGSNSIAGAYDYYRPRPQNFKDSLPPTSRDEPNLEKLFQIIKMLKNPADEKAELEGITKNISTTQQHLPTQEDLQQFARIQDMLRRQTMRQTIDQSINTMMNRRLVTQSQPNSINQFIQFLPRIKNATIPVNSIYSLHKRIRGPIDGVHTNNMPDSQNGVNIQFAAHNSQNQSIQNSKHPTQQDPRNYRHPWKANAYHGLPLKYNNVNLAEDPENLMVNLAPTTKDSKVQTMLSSFRPHETPASTFVQSSHVYQHTCSKKIMVYQATETDLMMDVDHYVDKNAGSLVSESASKVVNRSCQTDKWLRKEQGSTCRDLETATDQEIKSENEVVSDVRQTNLTNVKNLTLETQQTQSKTVVEQDMLDVIGTILIQLGNTLSFTHDMFNNIRHPDLVCAQTYEKLLEIVDKFNSIETLQVPPPHNVTSQVAQVIQVRSAGDNNINTGVGNTLTPIPEQRDSYTE